MVAVVKEDDMIRFTLVEKVEIFVLEHFKQHER